MAHEGSSRKGTEIRLAGAQSQSELAAMVGGRRQRVNAHLGELVEGGMIRLAGRESSSSTSMLSNGVESGSRPQGSKR